VQFQTRIDIICGFAVGEALVDRWQKLRIAIGWKGVALL
jgi:hypothetical protein